MLSSMRGGMLGCGMLWVLPGGMLGVMSGGMMCVVPGWLLWVIYGGANYGMLGGGMFEVLFCGGMFVVLLGCLKFGMMSRAMSSWMMFEMTLRTLLEARRIRLNLGIRERKN